MSEPTAVKRYFVAECVASVTALSELLDRAGPLRLNLHSVTTIPVTNHFCVVFERGRKMTAPDTEIEAALQK